MLIDLPQELLQRIIDRCDASDLFVVRQVCRRFRDAVAQRVRRVTLKTVPSNLALAFPRLTSLDVGYLSRLRCRSSWLAPALAQLPNLRELLGVDLHYHTNAQQALHGLSRVTRLRLVGHEVMLTGLADAAAHWRSLERLELGFCRLELAGLLAAVARLADTLTHLDLHLCEVEVTQQAMQALITGRLQWLRLNALRHPYDFCQQLAAFTSLSSLDLGGHSSVADGDLPHLNVLTQLTRLSLNDSAVTSAGVAQLTALTNLAALNLRSLGKLLGLGVQAHQDLPAALTCFPGLTDLDISDSWESAPFQSALGSLTRLSRLEASLSELMQQPLPRLPLLQVLQLRGSVWDQEQLRHLSGLCGLTRLSLARHLLNPYPPLHLDDALRMADHTALQDLCLAHCSLTQGALLQLAQLPRLRVLDLDRAVLPAECDLSPLLRLRLERLRLPSALVAADSLPPGLVVPVMKGRRWDGRQWPCG